MSYRNERSTVIDLKAIRSKLNLPTCFYATLAEQSGTTITRSRPGHLTGVCEADVSRVVDVRIRCVNVYRREAACYKRAGLPVPEHIQQKIETWDRQHCGASRS
ncbi:hypothetical protein GF380_02625 [Candidatus Uhrbacteria bacterium]|nr:hypothetical protein [Candidatus Uhrbacteria bacterium]MBD3284059.1 hypothetical protein [Candidatus Uhrbacteria bacterium]